MKMNLPVDFDVSWLIRNKTEPKIVKERGSMLIKGKFAEAKIYSDDVEQYAVAQLQMLCDNEVAQGSVIRVMPDVHPGKVGTIGLTMTIGKRIMPNLLGVDIGCGISMVQLKAKHLEFPQLDKVIRERVPSGFAVRNAPHLLAGEFPFSELRCYRHINLDKAKASLGTLGGGNHFIEVDKDEKGNLYLTVHSGSRHLGVEVTEHYLREGNKLLAAQGVKVDYPLTWLEGQLMEDYLADVEVVQSYAELNRNIMLKEIMKGLKVKPLETMTSIHNYVERTEQGLLLRKGAISAKEDETVLIPVNMQEGIIIGKGKGNEDWNQSAPHGSGRLLRRDEVKNNYTVSGFKQVMKDVYCSCIGADTLDEAPFAYRSLEKILAAVEPTVTVEKIVKPVYSFKAGGKG